MHKRSELGPQEKIRAGVVTYLNAKPLWAALAELDPRFEITLDHPSRWPERAGRRTARRGVDDPFDRDACSGGCSIVSDACIACDGPVRSVKLYGRVPVEDVPHAGVGRGLAHERRPW